MMVSWMGRSLLLWCMSVRALDLKVVDDAFWTQLILVVVSVGSLKAIDFN